MSEQCAQWPNDDDVVIVNDAGQPVGTQSKSTVHHAETPLHLAFSCYLFDRQNRLLLTRRASTKASFPGLWTNSVCGHPKPGESLGDAVRRRALDELGLTPRSLRLVLPTFRYRAVMDDLVEHEWCPVLVGWAEPEQCVPNAAEVGATDWQTWSGFAAQVAAKQRAVSPWCAMQVAALTTLGSSPDMWPLGLASHLPAALALGLDVEAA